MVEYVHIMFETCVLLAPDIASVRRSNYLII
jgi:hypothetical protein